MWLLEALLHLLRRGARTVDTAWEWVELFDEILERMMRLRDAKVPPANSGPLLPVRMATEVEVWPETGQWIPLEFEDRELGGLDNRRLVGRIVEVLLDHIALHRSAAVVEQIKAKRQEESAKQAEEAAKTAEEAAKKAGESAKAEECAKQADEHSKKAEYYALQVQDRGRKALRGVDLDGLKRVVMVEIELAKPKADPPPSSKELPESHVDVQFPSEALAIVTEGRVRREVRGKRRVWLLRTVLEAPGRTVKWRDLVKHQIAVAAERLTAAKADQRPLFAMKPASYQRMGNHIREQLGKLAYLWHQDCQGARWAATEP